MTKLTAHQYAMLHTPFFHMGVIAICLSVISLIFTRDLFLFFAYLLAGIILIATKLIWVFMNLEMLRELAEESQKDGKG